MSQNKDKVPVINITAIGDNSAEKTPLLLVVKGEPYPEDYEPTVFENLHETRTFQGKQYEIRLHDTAGQEEYDKLRPMSYAKTDVILMCFALDDPDSLKKCVDKWIVEKREYCPKAAVLLIGTKSELWKPDEEGAITQSQIDDVAKEIGSYKTILCSARKNENVSNILDLSIEAFLASKSGEKGDGNCFIA